MAQYDVDPGGKFQKAIDKAAKAVGDLRTPYKEMIGQWYKGNRSIFPESRGGPGKYADLSPKYKKAKTKAIGSPYPILRGFIKKAGSPARKSGKLADSMNNPGDQNAIATVFNKKVLILGTSVSGKGGAPYPTFLNFGTNKMPARPFMLIGGEQVATSAVNQRRKAWIKTLEDWVIQVSNKAID